MNAVNLLHDENWDDDQRCPDCGARPYPHGFCRPDCPRFQDDS